MSTSARVWLAGGSRQPAPTEKDTPSVRDDQGRVWAPAGGQWHTSDNRHHETWPALAARTDLVEVS